MDVMIQQLARSKVYIDESISNGLIFDMYLNMIPFCRGFIQLSTLSDGHKTDDEMDDMGDDEVDDDELDGDGWR
jgi:hypothetical protein